MLQDTIASADLKGMLRVHVCGNSRIPIGRKVVDGK